MRRIFFFLNLFGTFIVIPAVPENLTFDNITSNSCFVTWNKPYRLRNMNIKCTAYYTSTYDKEIWTKVDPITSHSMLQLFNLSYAYTE